MLGFSSDPIQLYLIILVSAGFLLSLSILFVFFLRFCQAFSSGRQRTRFTFRVVVEVVLLDVFHCGVKVIASGFYGYTSL